MHEPGRLRHPAPAREFGFGLLLEVARVQRAQHAALREVLGPTALQSGSYNRPGYLRLDFGWNSALSPDQLHDVEEVSNRALRADLPVSAQIMVVGAVIGAAWGSALYG